MSYISSSSLGAMNEYEHSVPIAFIIRAAGCIEGRIDRGIDFHSIHDMYRRRSAASSFRLTSCSNDTSHVLATALDSCVYRVLSRISVLKMCTLSCSVP